jgi:hypothetical protein
MKRRPYLLLLLSICGCWSICLSSTRGADLVDLLRRVPEDANVLLVVDIQGVLDSPLALAEGWRERLTDGSASRPLLLPPKGQRMVRAANFDLEEHRSTWQIAVVDFEEPFSLEKLAKREPGHLDKIANTPAFWCPRLAAYLVATGPGTLSAMFPANRQHVGRWLKQPGGRMSSYLAKAAESAAADGPQIVLAIDLEEAFDQDRIAAALETAELGDSNTDNKSVAATVAGVRGATFAMTLNNPPTGVLTVDFGGDVSALKSIAGPLVLEGLSRAGATLDDLESWKVTTGSRSITLSGELSRSSLMRLSSLFELPSLPLDDSGRDEDQSDGGDPKLYASQNHFKAVQELTDDLFGRKSAKTVGQKALWCEQFAKKIDGLSILNVDPELQDYSARVAEILRQAAAGMKGTTIRSRVRQVETQAASTGYDANYASGYGANGQRYTDAQRRTVRAQERGNAANIGVDARGQVEAETAAIRKVMVERYKVEF